MIFKDNIQRDCKHNFKWLEAKTAMSIYNGTLDIFIWLKWRRLCRFTDLKTVSFEKFICFTYAEKPLIHIWSEVSFQGYHCKLGNAIFAWRDTKDYDYSPIKIENQGAKFPDGAGGLSEQSQSAKCLCISGFISWILPIKNWIQIQK